MARNEMTEGSGLNRILSNVYGVQGPPAQFMASEVFPILVMASDRPEWGYLGDERLAGGFISDGAGVGLKSQVGIKVATTLRTIAVVHSVVLRQASATAADYQIRIGRSAVSDAAQKGFFRDSRFAINSQPSADLFQRTAAGTPQGNLLEQVRLQQDDTYEFHGPWVIHPDSYLAVNCDSTNTTCGCSFLWREYAASDGELRGV